MCHENIEIQAETEGKLLQVLRNINDNHSTIFEQVRLIQHKNIEGLDYTSYLLEALHQRNRHIANAVEETITGNSKNISDAIRVLSDWMQHEIVVRVIGAGRAKLAAIIPANRLAHGGARVYIQDGIIPMPHDVKAGGIIAASASGRTRSVLNVLEEVSQSSNQQNRNDVPFKIIGIAKENATNFSELCDVFIGIKSSNLPNSLRALADIEEMIICLILDAMVVAAGEYLGFDDTKWRLGHENLGSTGPYDTKESVIRPPHASHSIT